MIFKATGILRKFHENNKVQTSTLLSIKTGSCPENCKYCPQSAHYNTGLEKAALMDVEKILEAVSNLRVDLHFCLPLTISVCSLRQCFWDPFV